MRRGRRLPVEPRDVARVHEGIVVTEGTPARNYLTQPEDERVRELIAQGKGLPFGLAMRLLADRDRWLDRAFGVDEVRS
jgi:hypothetical protein